uniref:WAP domain-containing protein n=1 Tax=Nothoprocta perdicaria TaxID=30464 RepID=A0A8C6Z9Y0_NOTPE
GPASRPLAAALGPAAELLAAPGRSRGQGCGCNGPTSWAAPGCPQHHSCHNDSACSPGHKCCSLGCCAPKPGLCPRLRALRSGAACPNRCADDRGCPGALKCCFTGCGLACAAPQAGTAWCWCGERALAAPGTGRRP